MFDPRKIIEILNGHEVEYLILGGFAATLHGCPEQTYDLDILYANTTTNRLKLLAALDEIDAEWDHPLTDEILQQQPVFALNSTWGDVDIFSEVLGIGMYDEALPFVQFFELGNQRVSVFNLTALIVAKEAAADPNPRKRAALDYLKTLQQMTISDG